MLTNNNEYGDDSAILFKSLNFLSLSKKCVPTNILNVSMSGTIGKDINLTGLVSQMTRELQNIFFLQNMLALAKETKRNEE